MEGWFGKQISPNEWEFYPYYRELSDETFFRSIPLCPAPPPQRKRAPTTHHQGFFAHPPPVRPLVPPSSIAIPTNTKKKEQDGRLFPAKITVRLSSSSLRICPPSLFLGSAKRCTLSTDATQVLAVRPVRSDTERARYCRLTGTVPLLRPDERETRLANQCSVRLYCAQLCPYVSDLNQVIRHVKTRCWDALLHDVGNVDPAVLQIICPDPQVVHEAHLLYRFVHAMKQRRAVWLDDDDLNHIRVSSPSSSTILDRWTSHGRLVVRNKGGVWYGALHWAAQAHDLFEKNQGDALAAIRFEHDPTIPPITLSKVETPLLNNPVLRMDASRAVDDFVDRRQVVVTMLHGVRWHGLEDALYDWTTIGKSRIEFTLDFCSYARYVIQQWRETHDMAEPRCLVVSQNGHLSLPPSLRTAWTVRTLYPRGSSPRLVSLTSSLLHPDAMFMHETSTTDAQHTPLLLCPRRDPPTLSPLFCRSKSTSSSKTKTPPTVVPVASQLSPGMNMVEKSNVLACSREVGSCSYRELLVCSAERSTYDLIFFHSRPATTMDVLRWVRECLALCVPDTRLVWVVKPHCAIRGPRHALVFPTASTKRTECVL